MTKAPNAIGLRRGRRPYATPSPRTGPIDYLCRAIAVDIKSFAEGRDRPILEVLKEGFGEDDNTRIILARMVTKAAAIPADMTNSGWADTLVQTVVGDLIDSSIPNSIYSQIAARGTSLTLDRNGNILLPARNVAATVGGSFIAPGSPIPVRQGGFAPLILGTKKLGVITTMTREITEHSIPSIAAVLKQAMQEDTTVSIDSLLVDANPATGIRPAGLKAGVAKVGPTAGGNITAFVGDLKLLATALITSTKGNLRAPAWVMNTGDALAAALLPSSGGDFPFADQFSRSMLMGFPVVTSTTCPADTIFLLDAGDFVSIAGDTPQFSVSDQAVLHMEDSSPLAITTPGTPATIASPVRSLFQTDSIAVRMLLDLNWTMRRTGVVQWADGITWAP